MEKQKKLFYLNFVVGLIVGVISFVTNEIAYFVRLLPFGIFGCFVYQCFISKEKIATFLASEHFQSPHFIDALINLVVSGTAITAAFVVIQSLAGLYSNHSPKL